MKEMSLIIQTNPSQYDSQEDVLLLIDHKTIGSVNRFIKDTAWTPRLDAMDAFSDIIDALYTMFLGINYIDLKQKEKDKEKENSKLILEKMQLCDICLLRPFFCEYEKHMVNTGEQTSYDKYVERFIMKLPIIANQVMNRYEKERDEITRHSLAFAYNLAVEEITKYCDLTKTQKRLKQFSKKCCSKISETNTYMFGCTPTSKKHRSKKKSHKHSKKKYRFKKSKKRFKPGKYVSKKPLTKKQKLCPKGKKNCRCWVCNEEGHYANNCPNRKLHQQKAQMYEEIIRMELYPIEDEYEGHLNVLEIEIDPGPTSSDEEEDSSTDDESN